MELFLPSVLFGIICVVFRMQNVSGVRLTITPNTVSLEGNGNQPAPSPSTSEVVMECIADNLGNIEGVYSLYLKRESYPLAEISVIGTNTPKMSNGAPNDILSKAPTLEGSINNNNPSLSSLRARYLVSRMTCEDQATYHCVINYKPFSYESQKTNTSASLTVQVQPRNLQISAINLSNYMMIQNQSQVGRNGEVEFSCNGYTGGIQSTLIEWYRKTYLDFEFQRFYANQPGDSIDDGNPTLYQCEYMRTSKLRYQISAADSAFTKFRCEVPGLQTTGGAFRAYSQEFHIYTDTVTSGNSSNRLAETFNLYVLSVFALVHICLKQFL